MMFSHLLSLLFGVVSVAAKDQRPPLNPGGVPTDRRPGPGNVALQLLSKSSRIGSSYKEFDCSDVFAGMVLETDSENVDTLLQMDGVINAWPASIVKTPRVEKSVSPFSSNARHNYSMHQWTGVDRLHAKGIRGKGATVAIIDTGIDYTHEALGGCFGPGCKIVGGYDLVGPNWDTKYDEKFPKRPDEDPMDFHGHGTHVAGIIAADNSWLTGVAPDAELLIYKEPWETDEETIMQALCDAYHAGADVISTSIGQPNGFSDNPWALLSSRLVDKGVVITASAGNEGETGPFFSSSGAMGHGVLAVAAANVSADPHANMSDKSISPLPVYFTTWGPSNELLLKPDVAAPGYDVVSTVLNQSYEELSGTSMAAPYVAGIAALFIGEHGGREFHGAGFAKMLHDRIASSGSSLPWVSNRVHRKFTAPPFQVGTGLVNAWKVLNYDTQLDYEPFALMDTEMFVPKWKFRISNNGDKMHKYTFELEPQAGANILDNYYGILSLYSLEPRRIVPPVTLPDPVIIRPGDTREVEVMFALPDVNDDYLPLYGGKVWVVSNHGERLAIPYGGAAYDTEKAFDNMFIADPSITELDGDWSWSFNVNKNANDFIEIGARLSYPCTHLRWDIFDASWSEALWHYPPKVGERGYVGSATTYQDSDQFWFFSPSVNDIEDTVPFPLTRVVRGFRLFWWFGKLANGTQIAPGNYTVRFAALRPYGNPKISDHWDIMNNEVDNIQILPYNTTTNSTLMYRRIHH
ncbi:peptidase S8/S53 domain-containing protein [Ilyonectria robusta]|uniref:peptidase S8/S53 domain-containing protein n=1 Tax=Ilyonectria robusta TaxID=1079257 RepID=UPI001E8CE551|nr:peptidase S8/S53 domain-containing protein [Ilyonectria robusta]KAH8706750.1 peptidase S8/S53 domain-containing protein [Ilyonectria robusta]